MFLIIPFASSLSQLVSFNINININPSTDRRTPSSVREQIASAHRQLLQGGSKSGLCEGTSEGNCKSSTGHCFHYPILLFSFIHPITLNFRFSDNNPPICPFLSPPSIHLSNYFFNHSSSPSSISASINLSSSISIYMSMSISLSPAERSLRFIN